MPSERDKGTVICTLVPVGALLALKYRADSCWHNRVRILCGRVQWWHDERLQARAETRCLQRVQVMPLAVALLPPFGNSTF